MEKIKSVLSHGSRKSTDATHEDNSAPLRSTTTNPDSSNVAPTGQGSHFAAASGHNSEDHPIYDEMTGNAPRATSSGEPLKASEAPPHFSNTASLKQTSTTKPTLGATPASSQTGVFNSGGSTASIKSGVIGFPQGEDTHAALNKTPRVDYTQGEETPRSDQTKDTTVGTGVGGTAGTVHQLHHQPDHENLRASSTNQPFEQSFREPKLATDTDRSFPLAGGVTTRKLEDNSQVPHSGHEPTTTEREPGTKERALPTSSNHGKEGIAGAAALATAAGAYGTSQEQGQSEDRLDREQAGHGALSGLPESYNTNNNQVSSSDRELLRTEHELRSGHQHGTTNAGGSSLNQSAGSQIPSEHNKDSQHNNLALAAATTAAATSSSVPRYDPNKDHEHGGQGHTFTGDPCQSSHDVPTNVFTSGPHATDSANLFDPHQEPHLHIPGEFPETPAETPLDQRTGPSGGYIGGHSTRHGETATSSSGAPGEQHHYGRDAAIAGGLGAAGAGAYAATEHHREPADISNTTFPSEASPYSSTKIDPRVNPQAAKLEQQQIVPTSQAQTSTFDHNQPTTSQQGTVGQELTQEQEKEHHYGRNAGAVGAGAGLIGAGAAAAHLAHREGQQEPQSNPASSTSGNNVLDSKVQQPSQPAVGHHESRSTVENPASKTVGPHTSDTLNVLDPRVQPQPEAQKGNSTLGPHGTDTFNRLDPRVDSSEQRSTSEQYHGRDAAIIGATGATGVGAHEAATKYDEHRSTGPSASMNDQRYDPTLQGAHDPNQTSKHHYGQDAAVAGGLGAAGVGAYAASQHRDGNSQQIGSSSNYPTASSTSYPQEHHVQQPQQVSQTQQFQQPQPTSQAHQSQLAQRDPAHQRYDSVQNPEQHHDKRNAAALGAAGLAGAGGAYAYSQHDAEKAEKERLAHEKAQHKAAEKEQHAQEKAQKKAEEKELEHQRKEQQKQAEHERKQQQKELDHKLKEQEKAFQHEQHKIEQQQARDQKHQDKLAAAEEKKLQKEQSRRSEESEQDAQEGKEKKHRLFGFLHRDKDKQSHSNESSPRQSREYAGTGAAGLGASEISHESDSSDNKRHQRNRLHKDPPRGHPAYEALEHQRAEQSGRASTDRTDRLSGDRDTRPGAYESYASNEQPTKVTEPHTGLPMNVGKYGDGHGGTDGNANIHGHHEVPGASQQGGVTDWDAVRKANTPY